MGGNITYIGKPHSEIFDFAFKLANVDSILKGPYIFYIHQTSINKIHLFKMLKTEVMML